MQHPGYIPPSSTTPNVEGVLNQLSETEMQALGGQALHKTCAKFLALLYAERETSAMSPLFQTLTVKGVGLDPETTDIKSARAQVEKSLRMYFGMPEDTAGNNL